MHLEATGDGVSAGDEASAAEAAELEQQNLEAGGDAGDGQAPEGGAISERDRRLAEIRQQRAEVEETERREAKEQGLTATITGDAGGEGGQEEQAGKPNASELPPGVVLKDGKWFAEMKVSGQKQLVPFEQAFRESQKHHAADVRLQEANRLLRQAQEASQRAVAEAKAGARVDVQPSPGGDADGGESNEQLEAIAKELETGDIRKAVKMMFEISGRKNATLEANASDAALVETKVREVVERLEDQRMLVNAVDSYRKNHRDLASDPVLNSMVDQQTAVVMNDPEFEGRPYDEIIGEAVSRTRKIIAEHAGKANAATDTREQRKSAVVTPGAGKAVVRPQPAPPQPKTGRDVIAEMQAQRQRGR